MPFKSKSRKREYQREYMRKKREKEKTQYYYVITYPFTGGNKVYQIGERIPCEEAESWRNFQEILNLGWIKKIGVE